MKIDAGWKLCQRKPIAERGAGGKRGEDRRVRSSGERQRDDREGARGDRAHARGETVGAVREVHDVHHSDDSDKRERLAGALAEADRVHERQRHVVDVHPIRHRDRRCGELTGELHERVQAAVAPVVDRADERNRERSAHDAARLAVPRQEGDRRDHGRREDGEPAQSRDGTVVEVAVAREVDDSKPPREPSDRRGGGEGDQRGDEERPEGIELVHPGGGY
jgi:hypothetical protein